MTAGHHDRELWAFKPCALILYNGKTDGPGRIFQSEFEMVKKNTKWGTVFYRILGSHIGVKYGRIVGFKERLGILDHVSIPKRWGGGGGV